MMIGGYHSFGPGGFRDSPLADVLPINIGPAQRQGFGEPLRQDVQLAGPVRMRPAAPLGARHPIMQLEGSEVGGQRSGEVASQNQWDQLPPLDGANLIRAQRIEAERAGAGRGGRCAAASAAGGGAIGRRARAGVCGRFDVAVADARVRRRASALLAAVRVVAGEEG